MAPMNCPRPLETAQRATSVMGPPACPTPGSVTWATIAQRAQQCRSPALQEHFQVSPLTNLSLYKKRGVEFLQSVIIFAFFYQSSDRTGNTNDSFCMLCTAGKYCQDYGLALPNGDCYAGYYCPEGQDVPQPTNYACSPGHFCEVGSWNETGCPSGMYQPHWARSNCDICPAGSYCKAFGKFSLIVL